MANQLPSSVQLDGYDISDEQYPSRLPGNVSLQVLNVFDDLPHHLVEKYDIVHLRLFVCMVRENDPTPLLKQCLRLLSKCPHGAGHEARLKFKQLLEPGGYLQWGEYDLHEQVVLRSSSSENVSLTEMAQLMQSLELPTR